MGALLPETDESRLSAGAAPPADYLAALSDQHWATLVQQVHRLDGILESSRRAVACYQTVLDQHGCGSVIPEEFGPEVRLARFPLQVLDRERFVSAFARSGIKVGRWFSRPVSTPISSSSGYGYRPGSCPVAERVSAHIVNLPVHSRMSSADVQEAAQCLGEYLDRYPEERGFVTAALADEAAGSSPSARRAGRPSCA